MSKQIFPRELAEIVTGLLVKPELLGKFDSPAEHQAFMLDIGRVVANHCGGVINGVNTPETEDHYLEHHEHSPHDSTPSLSVSPDEHLPGLLRNVWACYDVTGWEEDYLDCDLVPAGEPFLTNDIERTRTALQGLLYQGEAKKCH